MTFSKACIQDRLSRGCIYESLFLILAVKQKFGDKDLDDESESSSSESEDEDARVSLFMMLN